MRHFRAPSGNRENRLQRILTVIVLCNTTAGGIMAVALPLRLSALGASKTTIAAFFLANAALAVLYSTLLLPRLQRHGYPRWGLLGASVAFPAGLLLVSVWGGTPVLYPAGVLMMFVSTIVPMAIGIASGQEAEGVDDPTVIARMRRAIVVGFIAGLALHSGVTALGGQAIVVAVGLAAGAAAVPLALPRGALARHVAVAPRAGTGTSPVRARVVVAACLVSIALMRGADQLRAVYLPLYADAQSVAQSQIAWLFLVTALLEIPLLSWLVLATRRRGPVPVLMACCAAGAGAFLLVTTAGGMVTLTLAQVVYAAFAAGFQSIGLVVLGKQLRGGNGAGANAFTAVMQTGTAVGVLLPLAVPGYSRPIFFIGAGLCAVAGVLLVSARSSLAPAEPARTRPTTTSV